MERVAVTIEGVSPILMNKFSDAAAMKTEGGTSATFIGSKGTPREQATGKLYIDDAGVIHLPGPNIFRAIIDAGSFHKAGKSKITTQKTSLVPAAVALLELTCPFFSPKGEELKWEVDSRSVVIPSTGGRIMAHRPRIDSWGLRFTLEVDTGMFALPLVRALLDDAGKRIGLGDFRPARKGPFGRFVVTAWAVENEVKRAA
jgi:hypothetical protein